MKTPNKLTHLSFLSLCFAAGLALAWNFLPAGKVALLQPDTSLKLAASALRLPDAMLVGDQPRLYYGCKNPVQIWVRQGNKLYVPKFGPAEGGKIMPARDVNDMSHIVPTSRTFRMGPLYSPDGKPLRVRPFAATVVKPPRPELEVIVNGKAVLPGAVVSRRSQIRVRIAANEAFAKALPTEARYFIPSVEVLASLDMGAPAKVLEVRAEGNQGNDGLSFNLADAGLLRTASAGTKVWIQLPKAFRINAFGQKEAAFNCSLSSQSFHVRIR